MSCFLYNWRVSIFCSIVEFNNYPTFHLEGIIKFPVSFEIFSIIDKKSLELGADSSSNQKYMKGKHELLTEYDFWNH